MPTLEAKVVEHVCQFPGCSELDAARAIFGPSGVQQRVNPSFRALVARGILVRSGPRPYRYSLGTESYVPVAPRVRSSGDVSALSEDEIKSVLDKWLQANGWTTVVKMGSERGIDIEARRGGERWIIEVKGPGSLQPMRVNYFIAILGETLQRMDDPNANFRSPESRPRQSAPAPGWLKTWGPAFRL